MDKGKDKLGFAMRNLESQLAGVSEKMRATLSGWTRVRSGEACWLELGAILAEQFGKVAGAMADDLEEQAREKAERERKYGSRS